MLSFIVNVLVIDVIIIIITIVIMLEINPRNRLLFRQSRTAQQ